MSFFRHFVLIESTISALLLLYIITNLSYFVLKMFLFCFCLVSLHVTRVTTVGSDGVI